MKESHIIVGRRARYYTVGDAANARFVWYGLHGYAQLARDFAADLSGLVKPGVAVVVPEALSRFYISGTDGQVGASWMTRHDREAEIHDYVDYLDDLRASIRDGRRAEEPATELLIGFSQGTATASRWLARSRSAGAFEGLVLWGGTVAPDVGTAGWTRLAAVPVRLLVFGDRDRYAGEERIAAEHAALAANGAPFELVRFKGGHVVDATTLASAGVRLMTRTRSRDPGKG